MVYSDVDGVYYREIWSPNPASKIVAEDGTELVAEWLGNIYQNKVILRSRDGKSMYMYEIGRDATAKKILDNDYLIHNPYFFDDLIVWSDDRYGTHDVFGFNLPNSTQFRITESETTDERIATVYNDKIAWVQSLPGEGIGDLYVAEISTVPIPGAVWLLGSGLVGLLGFRKKFTKG